MTVNTEKGSAQNNQKRNRGLIILSLLGLLLLIILQRRLLNLGPGLSSNQGVITLVSINFSVLTLALLLFLILRGLYRVFFEHKEYGSLQTKMVVAFIGLSLIPTLLIFYFAYLLVGQDQKTWFSESLKITIAQSLEQSRNSLDSERELFLLSSKLALSQFSALELKADSMLLDENSVTRLRTQDYLTSLEWYSRDGRILLSSLDAQLASLPTLPASVFEGLGEGVASSEVVTQTDFGPYTRLILPVSSQNPSPRHPQEGFFVTGRLELDLSQARAEILSKGLEKYDAVLGIERPFKVSQLTSLAAVTLVAVFFSIWIGSHLAGSLSAPVIELVEGTKRVAQGDLDFVLKPTASSGEMDHLVSAFNQMTSELKESYAELDTRRRFVETVLKQVSSGVMVLDNNHKLTDINEAALSILHLTRAEAKAPNTPLPILDLIGPPEGGPPPKGAIYLELPDGETLSLMVFQAKLKDEDNLTIGWLITFDDISELEKAQRLSAWREVAKRIAHEVKNPLTPISLAAQRLKRRFSDKLKGDPEAPIFEECTSVIIRQVDNMRSLVDEFSQFARLPQANPKPSDILEVINDSLTLFREAHTGIDFSLLVKQTPEIFSFDPVQMGRVISNLLANAASAINGVGKVEIEVDLDELQGVVITISDDGPGLSPGIRDSIFEPYVTTGGQGLGLSIVKTIVGDHGGYVRVLDRKPKGTSFRLSLPYQKKNT
ncbi:MAG: HAMP domain-containing protein [Deltaproteobacteria bacterium]|jgi:two-component system nitrogen regulation sensor histidine kinase NtrY|nr:HAMP domain-containing protein [Deltaproteobacteria bacterium]